MKGQLFIITTIFVLSGLIIIFNAIDVFVLTEERRFQEAMPLDKTAENIFNEFAFALGAATLGGQPNQTASDYIFNASSYMRDELDSEIFYAIIFVNGSNQNYNINIGNFLDRRLNVTLNATQSAPSGNNATMEDKTNTTFYFDPDISSGTVNITLSYRKGSINVTENLTATISSRNYMNALFDIVIFDHPSFIRVKETYNRTW